MILSRSLCNLRPSLSFFVSHFSKAFQHTGLFKSQSTGWSQILILNFQHTILYCFWRHQFGHKNSKEKPNRWIFKQSIKTYKPYTGTQFCEWRNSSQLQIHGRGNNSCANRNYISHMEERITTSTSWFWWNWKGLMNKLMMMASKQTWAGTINTYNMNKRHGSQKALINNGQRAKSWFLQKHWTAIHLS